MKENRQSKIILAMAVVAWLVLFGADKIYGFTFAQAGLVGFFLVYISLFALIAHLAQAKKQISD